MKQLQCVVGFPRFEAT